MIPLPNVSVESTFRGYGTDVLTDGRRIEIGKEITKEYGHADALGNCGNSWVSERHGREHWIQLDWNRPVRLDRLTVWWTRPDWFPHAFRVEVRRDQSWVSVIGADTWFKATAQKTSLGFPALSAQSLRLVQHAAAPGEVAVMAVQEIIPAYTQRNPADLAGLALLSDAELARLDAPRFPQDAAGLGRLQPVAVTAFAWLDSGRRIPCPQLIDDDPDSAPELPAQTRYIGVMWPVQHVVNRVELDVLDEPAGLELERFDGEQWVPLAATERSAPATGPHVFEFRRVATRGVRVGGIGTGLRLTHMRVLRYLPDDPRSWPEELVDGRFEQRILSQPGDPTFEQLSAAALSMRPAKALLGLKDARETVGVSWDGTLFSRRGTIEFRFGESAASLRQAGDTVTWGLLDGWRPAVRVSGQIGALEVTQTALVLPFTDGPDSGWLGVRVSVTNRAAEPVETAVQVAPGLDEHNTVSLRDGVLFSGHEVVARTPDACRYQAESHRLVLPLSIGAGGTRSIHVWQPCTAVNSAGAPLPRWQDAVARFQDYWDHALSPLITFELPEERVERMVRAVLAQLALCGEGDTMYYGAYPSAYARKLYGVEESYAMFALAYWGLARDAERYMNGTYLTPEFLRKVSSYETYAHRHQQYRNGLQPHFAVSLYRLTRNKAWIEPHLPLFRECAQWTVAERRKTMVDTDDGTRPLHWGLLPKWSYGGDIAGMQCYALYANAACLEGLEDTAWVLTQLGHQSEALRVAEEAASYRPRLNEVISRMAVREGPVPFLPLRLYADSPVGNDYYQLFAGVLLALGAFDPAAEPVSWLTGYMEANNLLFCGLPRFRRDVGPGGLDGLYGWGYLLTLLRQDRIEEFILGFYAYLAFNLERDTFAARETNLLYANDMQWYLPFRVPDISDPVPCSAAVALLLLRHMLISETRQSGLPPQADDSPLDIDLLKAAPRSWFRHGATIRWEDAPSEAGPISCELRSSVNAGYVDLEIKPPRRNPWHRLSVWVRHPQELPMQTVLVNGIEWRHRDAAVGRIDLFPGPERFSVRVQY